LINNFSSIHAIICFCLFTRRPLSEPAAVRDGPVIPIIPKST
jgi:hypothetical protein